MKNTSKKIAKTKLTSEERYLLYELSVQNPEGDISFINSEYKKIFNRKPLFLREDFGGTGFLSCEWVKQGSQHYSFSLDLDSEPMDFGKKNHWGKLSSHEQKRMNYLKSDVLKSQNFSADVIVAFNFSYFIFKTRQVMLEYFKKARSGLSKEGVFLLDIFGGTEAYQELVEETKHRTHQYFWDCDKFNPITNEVTYYIHFKKDGKKFEKAFTYDWRMWSIAEIKDILTEAGFRKINVYWEGDDGKGGGDGKFRVSKNAETCSSWISYIAAYD